MRVLIYTGKTGVTRGERITRFPFLLNPGKSAFHHAPHLACQSFATGVLKRTAFRGHTDSGSLVIGESGKFGSGTDGRAGKPSVLFSVTEFSTDSGHTCGSSGAIVLICACTPFWGDPLPRADGTGRRRVTSFPRSAHLLTQEVAANFWGRGERGFP